MNYCVDKIENRLAELIGDDSAVIVVPLDTLSFKVREGDILSFNELSNSFLPMPELTAKRRKANRKRLSDLFSRGK